MKKLFIIVSLLMALFLISACAPVSDEELDASLAKLSDEELDSLLGEMEAGKGALAGQAVLSKYGYTIRSVSPEKLLIAIQRQKIERLENQFASTASKDSVPPGIRPVGATPIEYGQPSPEGEIESPGEAEGFNPQPEPPK